MTEDSRDLEAMALLEQALGLPAAERAASLRARRDAEPEVIARALELLDTVGTASQQIRTGAASRIDDDAPLPERIGAYRVTELLGQGGMGAVYRAERDADDFERLVAIKVIRPGVLSERLVERFERERQILAGLLHPGIARLYDGGTGPDGGPYFVMEFIDGVPIDRWAASGGIGREDCLRLMIAVCGAVSFAHQNLVVHRDLTPSNVLVTADGQPKLIDFGIAKPQDEPSQPREGSGSLSKLSLTPGFAAPERYEGAAATTLSDVYSLGKLLEKLLARFPADPDLAAIVGKATQDDPEERYVTANAMALDIERFLDGHPVTARPVGKREQAAKFYRRNRPAVLASMGGLSILVGALLIAATAYFRAESARAAEASRVQQLRELADYMLFDHNAKLSGVIGNGAARAALVDKAQSYLLTLSELGDDDPSLRLDTARGFIELARIQGVSAQPNMGEHNVAKANLTRAEALLRDAGPQDNAGVAALLARLNAYRALIFMHAHSKPKEAAKAIAAGFAALDQVPEGKRSDDWLLARSDLRRTQLETADLDMNAEAMKKHVALLEKELGQWPAALQKSRRGQLDAVIAQFYAATALTFGESNDPPRAIAGYRKADAAFAKFLEAFPNDPYALYLRAWNAYYGHGTAAQNGQLATGEALLDEAQESVALLRQIEENDESLDWFAGLLREARADIDARLGRFDAAIATQQSIVDERIIAAERTDSSSRISDLAYGQVILADIARRAGRRRLACNNFAEAERNIAKVDARGDLRGYVENLRNGVRDNIARCDEGAAASSLKEIGDF